MLESVLIQTALKEDTMPISRAQFNEGLEDISYKIISFLKSRSDEAFVIEEIAEGVYGTSSKQGASVTAAEMMARTKILEFPLAELVKKGQVERKTIADKVYYCIALG
jgi:hypothetical protein